MRIINSGGRREFIKARSLIVFLIEVVVSSKSERIHRSFLETVSYIRRCPKDPGRVAHLVDARGDQSSDDKQHSRDGTHLTSVDVAPLLLTNGTLAVPPAPGASTSRVVKVRSQN